MSIKKIDSPKNPRVMEALSARRSGRRRSGGNGEFLVEGPNLIDAALRSARASIKSAFITSHCAERQAELVMALMRRGMMLYEVPDRVMEKLSDTDTPQGIVALCSMTPCSIDEVAIDKPLVVLDALQDPGNVGAIIRTADAAGAGAVLLMPATADPFMPKALRASAGSVFHIPIIDIKREDLARLSARGVRIFLTMPRAPLSAFDADLRPPCAFVFGNESHGVGGAAPHEIGGSAPLNSTSDDTVEYANLTQISLPIAGGAESLNVAATAAVILFESLRCRRKGTDPS